MIPHESDLNGGFFEFIERLHQQEGPLPWSLKYEERRWKSKEERVKRQVGLEAFWNGRPVEMLWKQLRPFALPSKDFKISDKDFMDFLTVSAVSPLIRQRIFSMMKERSSGNIDALVFCKAMDIALDDPATRDQILLHCFNSLPLPCDRPDSLIVDDVVLALNRLDRKSGKKKGKRRRLKMSSKDFIAVVRRQQLNSVKDVFTEELKVLTFPIFREIFITDGGKLASSFIKQLIEACAKYFLEPFGRFPVIPLRWTNTTTPIPWGTIPADTDSLLLQDVEYSGVDPNAKKPRKKKKK